MIILVTGAIGFIGYHLSSRLLSHSYNVIGIDSINAYYDPRLKYSRLERLKKHTNFDFCKVDIVDNKAVHDIIESTHPTYIVNLAAQAGVRYSIDNPYAYIDSNVIGFMNVLESCRKHPVKHLLFASSSSVYGGNKKAPFSTNHSVDHPVSLYAATKKSNELMAHTYSHLYGIPVTGLRFFTVYGPWGRPDMAYFSFTKDIIEGNPIKVFNHGKMERDFTYIDDVVEAIIKLIDMPPTSIKGWDETKDEMSSSFASYKIYNIGNNKPVQLMKFINTLEKIIGKEAKKVFTDMQPGDVLRTYADVSDLEKDISFKPSTSIEEGLEKFVEWYKSYYKVK